MLWPDPETAQRATLVVRFALVHGLGLHFLPGATVFLVECALCMSAPVVLRRTHSTRSAGNVLALAAFSVACFMSWVRDDLPVAALMFCAVVPLLTVYIVGRKASYVWAGLSALEKSLVFLTAGGLSPRTQAFLEGLKNPLLLKPKDLDRLREVILAAVGPRGAAGDAPTG